MRTVTDHVKSKILNSIASLALPLTMTFLPLLLTCPSAHANILFEGWFEVMLGQQKIGFSVQRYEFVDNKFKCVTYIKTSNDGNNVTESLKATTGADLAPLSYAYTSKAGETVKVIDATFKGDQMTTSTFDGKKTKKETKRIKKGTFLSDFLLYIILNQKNGLKPGSNFGYYAIAEEEGTAYLGSVKIKDQETVKGKQAYKILNSFKGQDFFTWISTKGEPLLTRMSDANIEVRIADNQAQATKGLTVNTNDLKLLFGKLPGEGSAAKSEIPSSPSSKSKSKVPQKTKTDDGPSAAESPGDESQTPQSPPQAPQSKSSIPGQGLQIHGVKPPPSSQQATDPTPESK